MSTHLPPAETRFKPGQSGNPGGKPKGARTRLTAAFINALADDFDEHGKQALEDCRKTKPEAYIKAIAALMPREVEHKHILDEMSDADLLAGIAALQSLVAAQAAAGGAGTASESQPAH
jgi:hypothetical protein